MTSIALHGLTAAVHTPFDRHLQLHLPSVRLQAEHLAANGVSYAFVAGSTGESHSLRLTERLALAEEWLKIGPAAGVKPVIHVGSNCLEDAREMAAHAEALRAAAIAAFAPCYFKPKTLDDLIAGCAFIAAGAPSTPFYFYDIPVLTGVNFSMPDFLERGRKQIPTLAGIKFTNADLMAYRTCLRTEFDIPWGIDEHMLGALATGSKGAVGSSFNFAAPVYHRLMAAFAIGDLDAARVEQDRSIQTIATLASFGYLAAAKAVMARLGVDVGQPRLPNASLSPAQTEDLMTKLTDIGFFDWIKS